jgi:hypothetical protein
MSYGVIQTVDPSGEFLVWHLHKATRGGEEYFVPEGGGETDWAPEYSPRSLRIPQNQPAQHSAWIKTGPEGHRVAWMCPKVWWK